MRAASACLLSAALWQPLTALRYESEQMMDPAPVVAPPDNATAAGPLDLSSMGANATRAGAFLSKTLGKDWNKLPVIAAGTHPPLMLAARVDYPSIYDITEFYDAGGLTGAGYRTCGLSWCLRFQGGFWSRHFGYNVIKAYHQGKEQFQLSRTKHAFNPFKYRYSYRILNPGPYTNENIRFTINRDMFGRGFMWAQSEYRVYLGRERDNKPVYYCVTDFWGLKTRCWHSQVEYDTYKMPCAILSQTYNAGVHLRGAPDHFTLFVNAGEDSALLTALSVLIDTVQDAQEDSQSSFIESKSNASETKATGPGQ